MLSKILKQNVIADYKKNDKDTGSAEVQIGLLTKQIKTLSEHLKINKKDKHSRRGLVTMVDKRRKFLKYIKSRNEEIYKKLMAKIAA